jgi:hypothetical protein
MTDREHYDRLADLIKTIGPERMREALVKTDVITFRVTAPDKRAMEAMAKVCGLTLTEYMTRLHYLAEQGMVELIEKETKGRKRGKR